MNIVFTFLKQNGNTIWHQIIVQGRGIKTVSFMFDRLYFPLKYIRGLVGKRFARALICAYAHNKGENRKKVRKNRVRTSAHIKIDRQVHRQGQPIQESTYSVCIHVTLGGRDVHSVCTHAYAYRGGVNSGPT